MITLFKDLNKISSVGLIIWFVAALFFLYEFFLRVFMGTIAKQLLSDLHLTPETFSIISFAYYLAYAVMQIPVGLLTDKFGVKRVLLFATALCAISTLLLANTSSIPIAFCSRMLMGLGSSFAFICLLVIAATWFPSNTFGFFSGASQFIGIIGPLLAGAPLLKALENTHGNWRYALNEIGIAGIILTLLVFIFVREKPQKEKIIFLEKQESFLKNVKRLFSTSQAWYICLYSAMVYLAMVLLGEIWGVIYLETNGLSSIDAANVISFLWLGYALGCLGLGTFSDAIQRRKSVLIFCSFLGIVSTSCIIYFSFHFAFVYAIFFFILGIAAAGQGVAFATIAENVDLATKASALGLNNSAITLFGMLFPLIVGFWIGAAVSNHGGNFQPPDFLPALRLISLLYLSAFLIAVFLIKETFCKPQKSFNTLRPNET